MPLAYDLRPKSIDDIIGQDHLVGKNGVIRKLLKNNHLPSLILYGNPGIGKTKIVEGLAWKYRETNPDITILQLDLLSLMSNVFMKGELENRVKTTKKTINGAVYTVNEEKKEKLSVVKLKEICEVK